MHIYIDESGTFTGQNNISAVGALIIPDRSVSGFSKLYSRLRSHLPKRNGEVKGSGLDEKQIKDLVAMLKALGCVFEFVGFDSAFTSEVDVIDHQKAQAQKMTENLTNKHHSTLVKEVWRLREQLERTSPQLYVQAVAMAELVYNAIFNADIYFAYRFPQELGEYHWIVDAKDRNKTTDWEKWWAATIMPLLESKSARSPFVRVEGGDYRWQDRFKAEPDDYKKVVLGVTEDFEVFDLRPVMEEDFRFSWEPEFGLEAVDILTNATRRALRGNLQREGWLPIRELMMHRKDHYIRLITLSKGDELPPKVSYSNVLADFSTGGREMLPPLDSHV